MSFRKLFRFVCACLLLSAGAALFSQVSPTEVKNARAKADEQKYMPQLVSLQKAIGTAQFPFTFRLARYLDAKPGQRAALDSNGLEFVDFHERVVLKVSAFYRVAFNSIQTTATGRASQTAEQAVLPVLRLITEQMPQNYDYDAIGFEILYDARDASGSYDYEGHEVLTVVIARDDAFALAMAANDAERQEILNRSDVFVNGKELELAFGQHDPEKVRPVEHAAVQRASFTPAKAFRPAADDAVAPHASGIHAAESADSSSNDLDPATLQRKLQTEVSAIRDGQPSASSQDAIPPSLETAGDQRMLHFTLQNTLSFDTVRSSIYKRAAQSFDLFLAPELKSISRRVPADASVDSLHFSVLNSLGAGKSETVEFICPMDSMRSFVEDKITSQEMINKSKVLVNGVRIGIDLQLVE